MTGYPRQSRRMAIATITSAAFFAASSLTVVREQSHQPNSWRPACPWSH
jgi:hypothetical protein